MTLIAKSGTPSLSTVQPPQNTVVGSGMKAGEAIAAGDLCYIASDGDANLCDSDAAATARCDGIAVREAANGEPVTLMRYVELHYGSSLTPGTLLYVGGTAGRLDDAPNAYGKTPVALVIDASRIFFFGSNADPAVLLSATSGIFKLAGGTATPDQNDYVVATGLTTVVAAVASLKGDPTLTHMWSGANIGDQAGSPAAGSILIWSMKPTAANDVTPIAATTPWSAVDWIAVGV